MNFPIQKDFEARGLSHNLPFLIPIFHSKNDISINELRTMKSNFQKVKDETKLEDSRTEVWISRQERISPIEESEKNCREHISFVGNFMNNIDTRVKNFTFGVSNGCRNLDFNDSSDKISFQECTKASNLISASSNSQLIFSSPSLHSLASLTVNCYKSNTEIQFNSSSDIYSPSMILSEDISSSSASNPKSNSKQSLVAEDAKNGNKVRQDLSCSLCSFSGASTEEMNSHLQIIHSTFRCLVCNFTSKSQARLNRHLMENHDQDGEMELQRRKIEVKKAKRLRRYSCKQCTFTTSVQEEIWMHTRVHVPASKLLSCPRCPFVCAFKHHMQYHLNNHFGFKPYKCELCNYRCNNKSMLNSHLKSHSSDYPFKCDKCSYATKYRQALYIHSSKANHSLDDEKSKSGILNIRLKWNKTPTSQRALSSDDEMKDGGSIDDLSYWEKVRSPLRSVGNGINSYQAGDQEDANEYRNDFNSSNNSSELKNFNLEKFHPVTSSFNSLITSLLPYPRSDVQAWSSKPDKNSSDAKKFEDHLSSPIDLSTNKASKDVTTHENENVVKKCDHCSIIFEDSTLFWCHMACHSPDSPFKCNLCGKKTRDKVEFFVHLCEVGHQPNVSKTCFPTEMSNPEF